MTFTKILNNNININYIECIKWRYLHEYEHGKLLHNKKRCV